MKKIYLTLLFAFLFALPFICAEASYTFQQNQTKQIKIPVLDDGNNPVSSSTACYLTFFDKDLNYIINDSQMNYMGAGIFSYTISSNVIGTHQAYMRCSNGSTSGYSTFTIDITATGDSPSSNQGYMVIAQLGIIALFTALGFSFSREKWKIRTLFFMASLFMGILTLNSLRIIAGTSTKLNIMANVGLITGITILSFMFLYMLIYYTIEVFRYFKEKKRMRWEVTQQ